MDRNKLIRNKLLDQNIKNSSFFNMRINELVYKSEDYLGDFYNESPNFLFDKDFVLKLIWLTYSNEEKKNILDNELALYFKN